jgi:hypothetical protein
MNKVTESEHRETDSCSALLLTMIFAKAFPVWELYKGVVPIETLTELDEAGDWPRGIAAALMKRLSRDAQLRNQFRKHCR